jgi:hypothetical protein
MERLIGKRKKKNILFYLLATAMFVGVQAGALAQDIVPQQLVDLATNVQEAFTGDLAKIIIGICFAGSCIAYAFNKDNEKMKVKLVAVIIATALLAVSQAIVDKVMG